MQTNDLLATKHNFISEDDKLRESDREQFNQVYDQIRKNNPHLRKSIIKDTNIHIRLNMISCHKHPTDLSYVKQKTLIQYPVSIKDCEHENRCMDFLEIYKLFKYHNVKEISCKVCPNTKEKQPNKITSENYVNLLYVEPCFNFIFKKVHSTHQELDLYRVQRSQYFVHPPYYFSNEKKIIFENSRTDISNFFISQKEQGNYNFSQFIPCNIQNLDFRAICLLNQSKLNIPVRFKECRHLEVYDLMNILIYCNKNQYLQAQDKQDYFECKFHQCKNKIPLEKIKLLNQIYLDQQLLTALLQGVSFSIQYKIYPEIKAIKDSLSGQNSDQYIQLIWKKQNRVNNPPFEIIEKVWESTSIAVAKGQNKTLDKDVENELLEDYEVNMLDKITNLLVEIPTRCTKCTDKKVVMELRSFVFYILNPENPHLNLQCPLCQKQLDDPPMNQICIDYDLYNYSSRSIQQLQSNQLIKINGKETVMGMFQKSKKITFEDYYQSDDFKRSKKIIFKNLYCQISKKKLKFPLINKNCNHDYYFDFDSIYEEYKKDKFKTISLCPICINVKKEDFKISNLIFNQCLQQFINQNSQSDYIEYNMETYIFTLQKPQQSQGQYISLSSDTLQQLPIPQPNRSQIVNTVNKSSEAYQSSYQYQPSTNLFQQPQQLMQQNTNFNFQMNQQNQFQGQNQYPQMTNQNQQINQPFNQNNQPQQAFHINFTLKKYDHSLYLHQARKQQK